MIQDFRYALRGIRRSPLFTASVAATIGLGLGVLCSAFTVLNAYMSAGLGAAVMQDGVQLPGLLVTGNYFQVLGARSVVGRTLLPTDAIAPGSNAVAVLSEYVWRSRFGADPAIVGKRIPLGRQSFEVVGVIRRGMVLPGQQSVIGQTLEIRPLDTRSQGVPAHTSVRIIGVTEDVATDMLGDHVDPTCVHFVTGARSPLEMSLLVRSRADVADVKTSVTNAVNVLDTDAPFRLTPMRDLLGL